MKKTIFLILFPLMAPAFAQETVLALDPAQTKVEFTLSDILHTVHGTFKLKRGTVRYDFASGKAAGEIVIDAQSGQSGSHARDQRMQKNIIESDRFPEISFVPDRVSGVLSKATVHGTFGIHGKDHEMTMVVEAVPAGKGMELKTQFVVPYVAWGMKNPSTLILRVGETVTIDVQAIGLVQSSLPGKAGTSGIGLKATSR